MYRAENPDIADNGIELAPKERFEQYLKDVLLKFLQTEREAYA